MYWVDLFYNKLERVQPVKQRRVYLATDDANLLPEAKEKLVRISWFLLTCHLSFLE